MINKADTEAISRFCKSIVSFMDNETIPRDKRFNAYTRACDRMVRICGVLADTDGRDTRHKEARKHLSEITEAAEKYSGCDFGEELGKDAARKEALDNFNEASRRRAQKECKNGL